MFFFYSCRDQVAINAENRKLIAASNESLRKDVVSILKCASKNIILSDNSFSITYENSEVRFTSTIGLPPSKREYYIYGASVMGMLSLTIHDGCIMDVNFIEAAPQMSPTGRTANIEKL